MSLMQTSAPREAKARARSALPDATSSTPLAGTHARDRHRERLPQPVQAERHQVVHQVVALRHPVENFLDALRLFLFRHALETEMGVGHAYYSRLAPAFFSFSRYSAQSFSWFSPR